VSGEKETEKRGRALDDRIEAALSSWPLRDRGDEAWEGLANHIDAKVVAAPDGEREADLLLEAPLPPATGEPSAPSLAEPATKEPASLQGLKPGKLNVELASLGAPGSGESKMGPPSKRDRSSLKDLAKLASATSLTPTPPASRAIPLPPPSAAPKTEKKEGDSGVIDLKQISQQDPGAEERAKSTPLAASELFADEPASGTSTKTAASAGPSSAKLESAPPSSKGRISSPPASAAAAKGDPPSPASSSPSSRAPAAEARPAPKAEPERKSGSIAWIAGVGGLLAAAAAAVVMFQSSSPAPTAAPAAPTQAAEPAAPRPRPARPPAEPVASAEAPPAASDDAVDLSALPSAPASAHGSSATKAIAAGPKKSVTVHDVPAAPTVNPDLIAKNIPTTPMGNGNLNDALRQAAGPTESSGGAATAPKSAVDPGSVPQKPSTGAVIGGVSAAMAQARSCLGLDDPISRAAITFESGGSVTGVVVTGFAAGKPAEACIKNAMKTAKVPPFAQPTYTQTLTIRPNS
jgi:hypothetical protein